ncbi:cubilin-like [Pollicipes pollicipes]|uniref:cubilin-like n=1 Tax=Pollicipes pollicipes TaxID=41117 RepID=UPI001884DA7E|nr:cubilin-like [Pollicipes pollicipes]
MSMLAAYVLLWGIGTSANAVKSWSHIDRDCELVVHERPPKPGSQGVFSSPGYPAPFPDRKFCVRHLFRAPEDHLVQLVLINVDLDASFQRPALVGCLSVFTRLAGPARAQLTRRPDTVVCDNATSARRAWYSSSPLLAVEFAADGNAGRRAGFAGLYRFVNRALFVTRGQRLPGPNCQLLLMSEDRLSGHIFSEGFPAASPVRDCSYTLYGSRRQRVVLSVRQLALQPADSTCLHGSRLTVHDGVNERSQAIGSLCQTDRRLELVSSGPFLHVTSHVADASQSDEVMGFMLQYRFEADPVKHSVPEEFVG